MAAPISDAEDEEAGGGTRTEWTERLLIGFGESPASKHQSHDEPQPIAELGSTALGPAAAGHAAEHNDPVLSVSSISSLSSVRSSIGTGDVGERDSITRKRNKRFI